MAGHLLAPRLPRKACSPQVLTRPRQAPLRTRGRFRAHTRRKGNQLRGTGRKQRHPPPRDRRCDRGCGQARLRRAVCRYAVGSHLEAAVHESEDHEHRRPACRPTWLDSRPRWHTCQERIQEDVPAEQYEQRSSRARQGVRAQACNRTRHYRSRACGPWYISIWHAVRPEPRASPQLRPGSAAEVN